MSLCFHQVGVLHIRHAEAVAALLQYIEYAASSLADVNSCGWWDACKIDMLY